MPFRFTVFVFILVMALTACGGATATPQDAAALPEVVPAPAQKSAATQPPPPVKPAAVAVAADAVAVKFNIKGGIVGFCDELVIKANGDYTLNTCNLGQSAGTLPQSGRVSLKSWLETLKAFQVHVEDNAAAADGLVTDLAFSGVGSADATDAQKQAIFDWVNGQVVQLRPKPQPAATPLPAATAAPLQGLCPEIQRPALMLIDFENPATMDLVNPTTKAACPITFSQPPFGRIAAAGGNIYYMVADSTAKTVIVWEINAKGEQKPLAFTAFTTEEPVPHGFAVADDGSKIAWSHTEINLEADPPVYKNFLAVANTDGSGLVKVLDGVENTEARFAYPIRFSTADKSLFYALQPDADGVMGRYDTLYRAPATGGEPVQVYACPADSNPVCITGLALDGSVFTALDPATDSLQVIGSDGTVINSIPLPAKDYVERATFGADGSLAFVSAKFAEPTAANADASTDAGDAATAPKPDPGYITVLAAPYTGQPQTVLSDNTVGTLWGWLDNSHLVYGAINAEGATGTAIVGLDSKMQEVSPKFAVGVLQ